MAAMAELGGEVDTSPKLEKPAEAREVTVIKVDESEFKDVLGGGWWSSGSQGDD